MGRIVLLAVAAAWAAVLIPPLLRSRVTNQPNSSVSDFRRQLSTLQRTVPTRTMVPMRSMARPLAPSQQRTAPAHRTTHQHRTAAPAQAPRAERMHGASLERRPAAGQQAHRQTHVHRVSQREMIRRRRANVLFVLGMSTAVSLFLLATTKAHTMAYLFALSFVSLCGYCYKLVQIKAYETDRTYGEQNWFNAA
jgi:hypothetical protein